MTDNNMTHDSADATSSYDNWLASWNERVDEIDGNIISWWNESWQSTAESLDTLHDKLAAWWDEQVLPEKASAEWNKARADRRLMEARIEQRVTRLVEDGKVKLAQIRAELRD